MGNPTVTPLVESFHNFGFIVSLANGHQSIDQMTLTGAAKVMAGTVLGAVVAALTAASAALGSNTGTGTFSAITVQAAPETSIGTYTILFTAPTAFTVTAPDGTTASGAPGTAFSGLGIGFTIAAGGTAFVAGDTFTVTALATQGNPTVTSAAGTNTGNGTLGSLTAAGYAATQGVYTVEFDDATHYVVSSPNGPEIGHGVTGTLFKAGGLSFTITAGGTAFVPGDSFTVTVAAGSGSVKSWDPANVDGSQIVVGILCATKDATLADKPCAVLTGLSEVNATELLWPVGASAATIAAGVAGLKAIGIRAR